MTAHSADECPASVVALVLAARVYPQGRWPIVPPPVSAGAFVLRDGVITRTVRSEAAGMLERALDAGVEAIDVRDLHRAGVRLQTKSLTALARTVALLQRARVPWMRCEGGVRLASEGAVPPEARALHGVNLLDEASGQYLPRPPAAAAAAPSVRFLDPWGAPIAISTATALRLVRGVLGDDAPALQGYRELRGPTCFAAGEVEGLETHEGVVHEPVTVGAITLVFAGARAPVEPTPEQLAAARQALLPRRLRGSPAQPARAANAPAPAAQQASGAAAAASGGGARRRRRRGGRRVQGATTAPPGAQPVQGGGAAPAARDEPLVPTRPPSPAAGAQVVAAAAAPALVAVLGLTAAGAGGGAAAPATPARAATPTVAAQSGPGHSSALAGAHAPAPAASPVARGQAGVPGGAAAAARAGELECVMGGRIRRRLPVSRCARRAHSTPRGASLPPAGRARGAAVRRRQRPRLWQARRGRTSRLISCGWAGRAVRRYAPPPW